METILLPTTVEFIDTDQENVGKVLITPCHQGYGTTLGNALRRVLLSSLPGAAVESVRITGVQHEFSAVEGVYEDVVQIILNLKLMAVKSYADGPVTLTLKKKGKGDVLAGDFEKNSDIEIANPDLKIATITDDKKTLEMEITIDKGRGYVPVEEKDSKGLDLGTILIDSIYTPIRDVGYNVELTRVGDVTDYEKLTLSIETNGTITPKAAVQESTKILMDHFALILDVAAEGSGPSLKESMVVEENNEEVSEAVNEGEEEVKETKKAKTEEKKEKKTKKSKK